MGRTSSQFKSIVVISAPYICGTSKYGLEFRDGSQFIKLSTFRHAYKDMIETAWQKLAFVKLWRVPPTKIFCFRILNMHMLHILTGSSQCNRKKFTRTPFSFQWKLSKRFQLCLSVRSRGKTEANN